MDVPAPPPAGPYALVERLHLRQWAMRAVAPVAAAATNGAGLLDVSWLPRHDAPGWPPAAETALRAAGGLLVVVSAGLRVLAKGVLVRKRTLTTGGVYGVVRHPFYLANLLGALGTFLLAGSLGAVIGVAWLALSAPLYAATIAGEEQGLRRLYPEEFKRYAAHVRALLPGRPPDGTPAASVTWANLRAEREPPRGLRFLALALAVFGLTLTGGAAAAVTGLAALAFGASFGLR